MCSNGTLEAEIDALAAVDVAGLPMAGLQDLVTLGTACRTRLDGIVSRAVGELQVRGSGQVPDPDHAGTVLPTAAWLRHTAKTSGSAAGRTIRTSVALRELPMVRDAIVDGEITEAHGRALADVFLLAHRYGDLPDAGGARPRVTYVVPASWALRWPTPARRALGIDALPSAGFFVDLDQHPGADCASAPWTGPATRTQIE